MSLMHVFRDYKMKNYVKILLMVLVLSGFINIVAAAPSLSLNIQNFNYGEWGSYYTVTYADEPYFAGYVSGKISSRDIFTYNATSNSGQLHKVLINDNIQRTININGTLALNDGYVLKIKDINMGAGTASVWLTMLKNGNEVYDDFTGEGQNLIYAKNIGALKELPLIAIHVLNISKVSKTVTIDGLFEISETFITVTPPSDIPMKITSWSNNQTNDQSLNVNVPLGKTVRFNITTNIQVDQILNASCGIGGGTQDATQDASGDNIGVNCFLNSIGLTQINITVRNNTSPVSVDSKVWMVSSTPTVTPLPTLTPTPTPTSTIKIPDIKQRAQLQVTYEVGSLINDRITIKVFLKNVGDATASNINLTIEHSHELEPIAASGSKQIGDTISWTGELLPNTTHITEYSVKAIKGKDVEIPLKVTYSKISREEKAKALGISPSASAASITQEDIDTIIMIIKILKSIPGFELIMAISILFLVHVFLKK
ncbi:MAG: hypothetical protein KKA10_13655 [Euryarchaeota archaeon]|nr:hypothetical protein [Euryarchaeota archaeon]MCG2738120.1 hypothetical protein [Candidatus Methanoperedenaceae archaeon]